MSFLFFGSLGSVEEGSSVADDQDHDWEKVEPDADVQLAIYLVNDEFEVGIDWSLVEVANFHAFRPVYLE